jgi:hypothetical protein
MDAGVEMAMTLGCDSAATACADRPANLCTQVDKLRRRLSEAIF